MFCSVNSAINPFITFRKTFAQMYKQFVEKRRRKFVKNEMKIKHLQNHHQQQAKTGNKSSKDNPCITYTNVCLVGNLLAKTNDKIPNESVLPALKFRQIRCLDVKDTGSDCQIDLQNLNKIFPNKENNEDQGDKMVHEGPHAISTACLTKHVLMKYVPQVYTNDV